MSSIRQNLFRVAFGVFAAAVFVSGCANADVSAPPVIEPTGAGDVVITNDNDAETPAEIPADGTVTLVTTNSFAISDDAVAAFEAQTGLTLNIVPVGSAGVLANQLVLTRDHPLGDAFFGVDNTFASRLIDHDVAAPFTGSGLSENAQTFAFEEYGLVPITQGDVCLNIDLEWFAQHPEVAAPQHLIDLLDPRLAGKAVIMNPATSSPGMAFLLATIAEFGDGELGTAGNWQPPADTSSAFGAEDWQSYWHQLLANDALIVDSWSQGYFSDFSGAGEGGTRPIVLSYASSPASTLNADGTASTTAALLDTCFLQVEFAGVLQGAANPAGAQQLIEFLSGPEFQSEIPEQMWVYPIDTAAELPTNWAQFTTRPDNPLYLGTQVIEQNRERWLEEWMQLALQ